MPGRAHSAPGCTGPPVALPLAQKPNLRCEAPSPGTRDPAMPASGGVGMGIHRGRPAIQVSRPASNRVQPTLQGDELSNRLVLMKCGERRKARASSLGRDMPECRPHLTAHQRPGSSARPHSRRCVCLARGVAGGAWWRIFSIPCPRTGWVLRCYRPR